MTGLVLGGAVVLHTAPNGDVQVTAVGLFLFVVLPVVLAILVVLAGWSGSDR